MSNSACTSSVPHALRIKFVFSKSRISESTSNDLLVWIYSKKECPTCRQPIGSRRLLRVDFNIQRISKYQTIDISLRIYFIFECKWYSKSINHRCEEVQQIRKHDEEAPCQGQAGLQDLHLHQQGQQGKIRCLTLGLYERWRWNQAVSEGAAEPVAQRVEA